MNRPKLQILSDRYTKTIKATWLKDGESPSGRQAFYHPDCEIWLNGRDSDMVGNVIMNALQNEHMSSMALRREKRHKRR